MGDKFVLRRNYMLAFYRIKTSTIKHRKINNF